MLVNDMACYRSGKVGHRLWVFTSTANRNCLSFQAMCYLWMTLSRGIPQHP